MQSNAQNRQVPFHSLVIDTGELRAAIDACTRCETACFALADQCLGGDEPGGWALGLRRDLACATTCAVTARQLSLLVAEEIQFSHEVDVTIEQLEECARACTACERICRLGDQSERTRECAEACHQCASACVLAAQALAKARA